MDLFKDTSLDAIATQISRCIVKEKAYITYGEIAQMVKQWTVEWEVLGSNPGMG